MKRLLLAAALLAAACSEAPPADPALVTIDSGQLRGVAADGVVSFKGVPFAAPPVDDLRWRAPQPAEAWDGVRDAHAYGDICTQVMPNTDNGIGQYPASEDCLTLNVFRQESGNKLPVMVWIHGGGFVNGSGSADLYDGSQLAKRGVVVVSINYRLGRFGSFAHPLLTAEAKAAGEPTANYGMMDMIASLEWVKQNIAAFGGDPDNVTIFGESAGGMAVQRLMTSPKARGLFHKAIVQSGAGRERPLELAAAEAAGNAFMGALGVATTDTAALRAASSVMILAAGDPSTFGGGGPVIDGEIIPMPVREAFEQGLEAPVPYITGFNGAEFPATPENIDARLTIAQLPMSAEQRAEFAALYPDAETFAAMAIGDIIFGEPARYLAGLHASNGQPSYLYHFDVVSESRRGQLKGTTHAQERQYVFDTLATSPYPTDANDKVQAGFAGAYWTNFAKTGDPNGKDLPEWPAFDAANGETLAFTNDGPVAGPTPHAERLDWIAAQQAAR